MITGTPFVSAMELDLYAWADDHLPAAARDIERAWLSVETVRRYLGRVLVRRVEREPQHLFDLAVDHAAELLPFATVPGLGKLAAMSSVEWVAQLATVETFCRQPLLTDADWGLLLKPAARNPIPVAVVATSPKPRRSTSMFAYT